MMRKLFFCLIILILPVLARMPILYADETPLPITIIGTENNPPFSFTLPDGTKTGFYVEFWQLWSKTNGIPINVNLTSFEASLAALKNKGVIHTGLFINENRQQWADFSLPFHRVTTGILYSRNYSETTKFGDTKGLRVAVGASSYTVDYLKKSFPSVELVLYSNAKESIDLLLNDEVDVIVAELPFLEALLAKYGLIGVYTISDEILITNEVHGVIAKGQPELVELINRGIENIPINALVKLEKKWLPTLEPFFKDRTTFPDLTIIENIWLRTHNSFSLGIDRSYPPFEFIGENGDFKGINADYINYMSETLNIEFNVSNNFTWFEALEALKLGKVDIMSGIKNTPEREKVMNFTQPFFVMPTVMVIRKNSFYADTMSHLNGKKVGIIKGYATINDVKEDYPQIIIQPVNSVTDGLAKLQAGEIDAYLGGLAVINFEMGQKHITDLKIALFTPYNFELSVAVRKGLEPLVPILNKVLAKMDESKKAAIANNWLSVHVQSGATAKDILLWTVPILLLFSLIIFTIIRVNRRLESEINSRVQSEKERRVLEIKLRQSQKLEALGKLTGGIAHDYNNMLGVILGYSDLLKRHLKDQPKLINYVNQIYLAGERGAKFNKKILSFSSIKSSEAEPANINTLVLDQKDMLQKTLTLRIALSFELADDIWPIWIDHNELEDALLNLSINAMHAMNNIENAKLIIRTSNLSLKELDSLNLGLIEGDYVQLSLIDNGCGMSETTKEQIFDPFFTTKGTGGTGLGLSQVFGFAQSCKGTINVISEINNGSQFNLYFPRFLGDKVDEKITEKEINTDIRGSETILIVDDEDALRHLAEEILRDNGYKIIAVDSAKKALEILEQKPIDLILSDVIMPEMDGFQLAALVREKYPTIKIQLVSGYANVKSSDMVEDELHLNMLHKPYTANALLQSIRALLDN